MTATRQFDAGRLAVVLLAPVVSEKGTYIADKHSQVIFKVMPNATKPEVKAAVEARSRSTASRSPTSAARKNASVSTPAGAAAGKRRTSA